MAFEKNWRERKIIHRTPGGKMTRVKISSLPAEEQQKYNPNRFKRLGGNTMMSQDDYMEIQRHDFEAGYIFDFYVQYHGVDELKEIPEGTQIVAVIDGTKVNDIFHDEDQDIIRVKKVPMDAVKSVIVVPEDGDINYDDVSENDFEDISELEDKEKYEKIKFNDIGIYKIDISNFVEWLEIYIDDPDVKDIKEKAVSVVKEGFYNFYYSGE